MPQTITRVDGRLPVLLLLLFASGTIAHAAAVPNKPKIQVTDADVERSIHTRLARSKIAADKFQFKVQGGVVTIEGKTSVIQRKKGSHPDGPRGGGDAGSE